MSLHVEHQISSVHTLYHKEQPAQSEGEKGLKQIHTGKEAVQQYTWREEKGEERERGERL